MFKMMRHMKRYAWMLLLIVLLLAVQAVCDLALPSYTASIVDVGIQQQGIEHVAPTVVRESTLNALLTLMEADGQTAVRDAYAPMSAEDVIRNGMKSEETVYQRKQTDADALTRLDELFTRAFAIDSAMAGGMNGEQMQSAAAQIPESMLTQLSNKAVRQEYEALGMNLDAIQRNAILLAGVKMLLIALLGAGAAVAVGYFGALAAASLGRDLRVKVFEKVVSFSQQEMDQFSTASLITRSTNDIQQVQQVMVMLLRVVVYAPIIAIGGVLRAWQTNASMAWVIGLGVAAVICVVTVMFSLGMPRFKRMQTLIDNVNQRMRETLTGLPVIRAFCTQKREEERFDEASLKLQKTQLFVGRLMSGMMPIMMLVMNGIAILIIWVAAHGIEQGVMQVGDMMAYIQYTMQIIMAFLMISMMSVMLPRASVSAKRVQEVLDAPLSITEKPAAQAFDEQKRGVVEFRDVSFHYPGSDTDMLSHITFTALPGQTTAILGGTGSGKTTLINLVPRFYDVTEGQVLVDGVDVRDVSMTDLRDRIGYVPQKGVLFSGTVESNLSFGSAEIGEESIKQAARVAQAEDFILAKDGGYQAEISQGGTNVSGGQKQRLSIARAVAKHPEIFIFDDSFSALDFKTDVAVRAALGKATGQSTILIVAQRISTVMHAQQILVLDEGKLVGKGTHEELLQSCEVYRQIATSQLSKEELSNAK